MSFKDLDEFFDDTLTLPIAGKSYRIESPDAKTGLLVQGLMAVAADARAGRPVDPAELQALQLDDEAEKNLHQRLLGDAYDTMLADGVTWHRVQHAGQTVIFWIVRGKAFAEAYWNGGGTPKALTPKKRGKAKAKKAPPASPASSPSPAGTTESTTPGPTS